MANSYAARKARMDQDPAFARRVLDQQMDARRRRRERDFIRHIEDHTEAACQHVYRGGRRCWRIDEHQHAA